MAAPLAIAHIDTDQILPARYMKTLTRAGLGRHLFHAWRFTDDGDEVPDFILNRPAWREAEILIAYENFGCGSSREHAVWALGDFGIRAIIAPSFGSIFATNCVKNGILPVVLPWETCRELIDQSTGMPGACITVDLEEQQVHAPDGNRLSFNVQQDIRKTLICGLDDIARTLAFDDALASFEARSSRWVDPVPRLKEDS